MTEALREKNARCLALARDRGVLSGVQLYAQTAVGLALYLYDRVSTPGYLSLLLTLPYLLAVSALARRAKKRAENGDPWGSGSLGRGLSLAAALVCMLDAQLLFFALCAIAEDVMPDLPPLTAALTLALAMGLSVSGCHARDALPRLARPVRWFAAAALGFCALSALPYGQADHFFPLLGSGHASVGRGALWMCGACAGCVWTWLSPGGEECPPARTLLLPWARSAAAGIATMLISVWLMPFFFMARPETAGWRLLTLTNMTPSVPAWSLNVLGLCSVLLLALCASLSRAGELLIRFAGRDGPSPAFSFLLPLLLIPAALPSTGAQDALVRAAPWRAAATVAILGMMLLRPRLSGRRT